MPAAVTAGVVVSACTASTGEGWSGTGTVDATSDTFTGVPGALDSVGETEIGAEPEVELGTEDVGTGSWGTGGPGAVSPLAKTAASRSFKRLKRGGLSCLGGLAGLDRRGLSLLL